MMVITSVRFEPLITILLYSPSRARAVMMYSAACLVWSLSLVLANCPHVDAHSVAQITHIISQ